MALLSVATAAMLAAAAGPIYLLGAQESVIRDTLASASVLDRGLTLTAAPFIQNQGPPPEQRLLQALDAGTQMGIQQWFGSPIKNSSVHIALSRPADSDRYETDVIARDQVCDHIRISAGRCPQAPNEAVISDRSASQLHAVIGDRLDYRFSGFQASQGLTIVGIYAPADISQPYWFGHNLFTYTPPPPSIGAGPPFELDAFFVTAPTIDALPAYAAPSVTADLPLDVIQVNHSNLAIVQSALAVYSTLSIERFSVSSASQLPAIIGRLQDIQRQMAQVIGLISVQLVLVGLGVLYGVVSTSAASREHEVALARLRGHSLPQVLGIGLFEPLSLVVFSWPIGIALAWLAVQAIGARFFLPGTAVVVDAFTLAATAAAFAGAVTAIAISAARLLTRGLAQQLRSTPSPSAATRVGQLTDVAAITLAAAGLLELAANGTFSGTEPNPLAIVAPGLLCLSFALIGARVLVLILVPLARRRSMSSGAGRYIATRRLVRVPAAARQIVVPSLALGLVLFATATWSVADTNRGEVALFQVGANRVLVVDAAKGVDLISAVRKADPGGHDAMAVFDYAWSGGAVLAIDSTRLASVADWPAGVGDRDAVALAKWLQPLTAAPILVRGGAARLSISTTTAASVSPSLELTLQDNNRLAQDLSVGPLLSGSHQYTVALPASCVSDCRIIGLTQTWPLGSNPIDRVTLAITGLEVADRIDGPWRIANTGWRDPAEWRAGTTDVKVAQPTAGSGLELTFANTSGPQQVTSADVPPQLTAMVTPDQVLLNGNGNDAAIYAQGLDGNSIFLDGRAHASAIPRLGPSGVLVDLTLLERMQRLPTKNVGQEVWLSPNASAELVQRLSNEGIGVVATQSAAESKARLDREGLSLAFNLMPFAAILAAALAFGSTAFAIAASARHRSYELAILRAYGWSVSSIARGYFGEQLVLAITACVIGAAAGLAGARLALPSVPEFTTDTWGLPLRFDLPWLLLAAVLLTIVAMLIATAVFTLPWLLASATPARLSRGAP